MKLKTIGVDLEPFEIASDEDALAYIAAIAIDVAVGTNNTVSAIGFSARKVGDLLEIQPVDRAQYANGLDAVGAVEVAEQVRETPAGAVPLVNCSAFPEHGPVVFLTPTTIGPGGDA